MSSLTEEQIVHIEFEYDLASIQSEIDNVKAQIAGGEDSVENYASVIAGNSQYIDTAKNGLGLDNKGVKLPTNLEVTENSIADLYSQIKNASGDKKIELQAELANQQELEKSILNSFSDQNPEITPDTDVSKINEAWDKYFNKEQHIVVDAELNDSSVKSQLSQLKAGSTITYTANVDGVESQVTAVKNEDGTITYTADVGDAEQKVNAVENKDGTITYTVNEVEGTKVNKENKTVNQTVNQTEGKKVPTETSNATQVVDRTIGQDVPTIAPDATQKVNRILGTNVSTTLSPITQIVNRKVVEQKSTGTMLSPAHASGTAYNMLNLKPAYADGKVSLPRNEEALVNELGILKC